MVEAGVPEKINTPTPPSLRKMPGFCKKFFGILRQGKIPQFKEKCSKEEFCFDNATMQNELDALLAHLPAPVQKWFSGLNWFKGGWVKL